MDNPRAPTKKRRQNKRAPYSFEGNTINILDFFRTGAQTFTMTQAEARALLDAKRRKRKIKLAVNGQIENNVEKIEDCGTVENVSILSLCIYLMELAS
jgi:hypothetical protein